LQFSLQYICHVQTVCELVISSECQTSDGSCLEFAGQEKRIEGLGVAQAVSYIFRMKLQIYLSNIFILKRLLENANFEQNNSSTQYLNLSCLFMH